MKIAHMIAAVTLASAIPAYAQSAAHERLLSKFKGPSERTVKDAIWTSKTMFKVGVLDNGTSRDGFAAYVCEEAAAEGLTGISVQVIDIAKLKRSGDWVKLGEHRCR